ncbi:hypothetical protein E3O44_06130 [Cryobacterium algoricola]|uniref:DUF6458 domain-containing protein n=1 Tax=Cryobacterium algoricola TaxID=1259183 RepID=A0ABY2IH11_9MICO|nr:DUF6458 family protein [Cryobacterium algoricola]TFB88248.1 hypothetical protein E3O44_06130 [Cryobacterium algoricola]
MKLVMGIFLYVVGILAVWVFPAVGDVDLHMIGYVTMSLGALVIVFALIKLVGGRRSARRRLESGDSDIQAGRVNDA